MKKKAYVLYVCLAMCMAAAFPCAACAAEHVHEYGDWTVTKQPTCTAEGEEKRECLHCDADETRKIPALGHDWKSDLSYKIEEGEVISYRVCGRCGTTGEEKKVENAKIASPDTLGGMLASAEENSTIFLGGGSYTQAIAVTKKMSLIAAGEVTVTAPVSVTADGVTLQGWTVKHTYVPKSDGETVANEVYLFDVSGKDLTMRNCEISRTNGIMPPYGFLVRLTAEEGTASFYGCRFTAPVAGNADAIHAVSPSVIGGPCALHMEDCTIRTNGYAVFNRSGKAVFRRVTFEGLQGELPAGVTVSALYMAMNHAGMEDVLFDGCTIRGARSWGILAAGKKLTVTGCTFEACMSRMVSFAYGTIEECVLTDDLFDLSLSGYGVKFDENSLTESSKVTISGNTFRDGDTAGKEDGYCISNLNGVAVKATGNKFEKCTKQTAGAVTLS